ncbi:MAG: hypothetical protein PHH85_01865 [Candidatus Methanoperedens sp.]|nr:hypothetical protein [Candidatus Methanoperedens sp.]
MMIINWKSKITGASGHGQPIEDKYALTEIKRCNRTFPDIKHWAQVV